MYQNALFQTFSLLTSERLLKILSEQVRRLDKKRSAVAAETGLVQARKRIKAIVIQIVVVTGVKSRARTRGPAENQLRTKTRRDV